MRIHLSNRGSSGNHSPPVRDNFHIYLEVLRPGVGIPVGFPGCFSYPGIAPGYTVGLHSQSVQATVQADMEGGLWRQYSITGGTGGVPSTTLAVTGNGIRILKDVRITGTGIPADTSIVSYDNPGSNTGNITLSQSATVSAGTTLQVWSPGTHTFGGPIGGNGGVSGTSITITSSGETIRVGAPVYGYGIAYGTRVVSYTGGASGTMVISEAAAVANGCMLQIGHEVFESRMWVADWEGGGATPTSMKNCLNWMRGATGYSGATFPTGVNSPPLGIYWQRECALNHPVVPLDNLSDSLLQISRDINDTMTGAVTGTGNETCNYVCPEIYDNHGPVKMMFDIRFVSREWQRQGIPGKLVPMINPTNFVSGNTGIHGKSWRSVLECGFHDANVSGLFIWHADRGRDWDENEEWFQETLDFIDTYNIQRAPKEN